MTDKGIWSQFAADAIARLQRVLDDYVHALGNLGAIAGIDIPGTNGIRLAAGHADIGATVPALSSHLFQIGSQSKTVMAMTMLQLERSGLLDLDDPVVKYVELPIDQRITIRHLLMNSSGLGEYTFAFQLGRYDPRIRYMPRDLVGMALPQGQIFEPGARFDYCNTGWVIAAMVMEAVTGHAYDEIIRERVLAPLDLSDTWFGGHAPKGRMLSGYITSPALSGPTDSSDCLSWAFGAGDGVSSLDNTLALFGSLIRPDNPTGISLANLTGRTGKPSANPHFAMSIGTEYGLGLERRAWAGREVWGHPGSTYSYMTSTWIDAGLGLSVATCVTRVASVTATDLELRYPRAQLFAMILNTAYVLANDGQIHGAQHASR
jgi:D-alanyl-D-alanine carboxypeptidase